MKKQRKAVHQAAVSEGRISPGNTGHIHGNAGGHDKPESGRREARRASRGGSDVFSRAKRSAVMAQIKGRGNKATELRLITLMRAHAITGWRRGSKLPGKPDFVFSGKRLAVFVDGCFWHGCPVHATWPKNNAAFWEAKILGNRARDRAVTRELKRAGWRVLRIWEHSLSRKHASRTVARLRRALAE